ncbi:hypothetical protein C4J99_1537 [Pseudomonas synxantha]|nr:hypothetical protein C4J99_1537 [Pseudomonas synxantha]
MTPINYKQLASENANDWSSPVQTGGQVKCNFPLTTIPQ